MPIEILMPALSPTMTEGNLAKWHKKEGETVKSGDVLAEIETDKATMEVEAIDEGTLGKIVVPEGAQGVKVNSVIAVLLEEGEDAKSLAGADKPATKPPPASAAAPAQATPAAPAPVDPKTAPPPAAVPPASRANGASADDRVFASPLAKRMAAQAGLVGEVEPVGADRAGDSVGCPAVVPMHVVEAPTAVGQALDVA